jgi:hypothetical protein
LRLYLSGDGIDGQFGRLVLCGPDALEIKRRSKVKIDAFNLDSFFLDVVGVGRAKVLS